MGVDLKDYGAAMALGTSEIAAGDRLRLNNTDVVAALRQPVSPD